MMMDAGSPCARLCHITKWEHFDGYGFNLHAEKGKIGQFIGKVDEGSPSEAAGLRQGDRIIEVNEINIANETHKQVVERIKAFPTETKLLVVDQSADDYFKANNIPIKGTMPGIKYLKTPEPSFTQEDEDEMDNNSRTSGSLAQTAAAATAGAAKTTSNGSQGTTSDTHSIASSGDGHSSGPTGKENGSTMNNGMTTTTTTTNNNNNNNNSNNNNNNNNGSSSNNSMTTRLEDEDNLSTKSSASGSGKDVIQPADEDSSPNGASAGSLNLLQMSAKELRAKLAARKKYDPKKTSMGFKDKFDIVQKL